MELFVKRCSDPDCQLLCALQFEKCPTCGGGLFSSVTEEELEETMENHDPVIIALGSNGSSSFWGTAGYLCQSALSKTPP